MRVLDDVIGDAPLYPSALLSRALSRVTLASYQLYIKSLAGTILEVLSSNGNTKEGLSSFDSGRVDLSRLGFRIALFIDMPSTIPEPLQQELCSKPLLSQRDVRRVHR
jgi:hypothetical protein